MKIFLIDAIETVIHERLRTSNISSSGRRGQGARTDNLKPNRFINIDLTEDFAILNLTVHTKK